MKKVLLFLALISSSLFAGTYIEVNSSLSVNQATAKIKKAIDKKKGFSVFTIIDHKKNAKGVGMKMPATKLIIFGNPKAGTMLMKANKMMAYELPLKILISKRKGKTVISYRDPDWFATNYGLYKSPIIPKMKKVMKLFSQAGR